MFVSMAIPCVMAFLFVCIPARSADGQDLLRLAEQIRSGNTENKRDALIALRNVGTEAASRAAIPALSDPDEIVRAAAVSAILHLPSAEALALLTPLTSDAAEFVRREAVYALGELGDRSASSILVTRLRSDRADIVRAAAAHALGKAGDVAAVTALAGVLAVRPSDDDEYLRRSAARSIGQIAERESRLTVTEVTPQNFLSPEYKRVDADGASPTQGSRSFSDAVTILIRVLSSGKEATDTRREAAFALGAIGDAAAIPVLTANAGSQDSYLAEICREALLKLAKTR